MKICVVDHGIGNFFSIKNALDSLNYKSSISNDINIIEQSDILLFAGVGAFGSVCKSIKKMKFFSNINNIKNEKKIVGICSGMQVLMKKSKEFNTSEEGLGLFNGEVEYLKDYITSDLAKFPNTGWHQITFKEKNLINNSIVLKSEFYFNHSLFCKINDKSCDIIASNNYHGFEYPCIIKKGNIFGIQFHPEKSKKQGLLLLDQILNLK